MKAEPQRGAQETAALMERAERVMREAKTLLQERELQLRNLEQFLEQNPEIEHGKRFSWLKEI
jgi:hypothetical protein